MDLYSVLTQTGWQMKGIRRGSRPRFADRMGAPGRNPSALEQSGTEEFVCKGRSEAG